MADATRHFLDLIDRYQGHLIGVVALAAVMLLNQRIFRRRWASYPTLEQYLAAHPGCDRARGVTCNRCGTRASGLRVTGKGRLYRCAGCEIELYRVDDAEARE